MRWPGAEQPGAEQPGAEQLGAGHTRLDAERVSNLAAPEALQTARVGLGARGKAGGAGCTREAALATLI